MVRLVDLLMLLAILASTLALSTPKHSHAAIHHRRTENLAVEHSHPTSQADISDLEEEEEEEVGEYCPGDIKSSEPLVKTKHNKPNVAYFVLVGTNGFDELSPPLQQLVKVFDHMGNFKKSKFIKKSPEISGLYLQLETMDINNPTSFDAPIATIDNFLDKAAMETDKQKRLRKKSKLMSLLPAMKKALVILKSIATMEIECSFQYAADSYTDIQITCNSQSDGGLLAPFNALLDKFKEKIKSGLTNSQPPACQCRDDDNFQSHGIITITNDFLRGLNQASEMQIGMNLGILIGLTSEGGCPIDQHATYIGKAPIYAADWGIKFNYWFLGKIATYLKDQLQTAVLSEPDLKTVSEVRKLRKNLMTRLHDLKSVTGDVVKPTHPVLQLRNGVSLFNLRKGTSNSLKNIQYDAENIHPSLLKFIDADNAMHSLVTKAKHGTLNMDDFKNLNQGNEMRVADNTRDKEWVREGNTGGLNDIYLPPSAVPQAVTDLINWFNTQTSTSKNRRMTILTGARAFAWCVSIHPFHDGNGRACRMLGDLAFMAGSILPGHWSDSVAIYPQRIRNKEGGGFDALATAGALVQMGKTAAKAAVNTICGENVNCE